MTHLQINEPAPDFSAPDQNGKIHKLTDYKGKKLVLFFYPKASTPGCTQEAKNLRDHLSDLREAGYDVIGISADTVRRQYNFAIKNELPFPLLSDEDRTIVNAYGVWGAKKFMGREYEGIHRTTFLIDEKGIIRRIIDKVKVKDHATQILETD